MRKTLVLATIITLALASGAFGMLMDSSGNVTDWGVTPFSLPNQSNMSNGALWSTISNDYSPIAYPGIGHVPSPGGATGETFDLEEMHLRITDTQVQVLAVTGAAFSKYAAGQTWYLGDLFVTVGGRQYGIVTQSGSQGLAAGGVYRIDGSTDFVALQPGGGGYASNTTPVANDYGPNALIRDVAGPWAVAAGIDASQLVGSAVIDWDTFNYGADESGTFLIEYAIDLALFGVAADQMPMFAHMTWGCGNDVIEVHGNPPYVPEPATMALLALGAAATWWSRRRSAQD
jgi:hypothetical protein